MAVCVKGPIAAIQRILFARHCLEAALKQVVLLLEDADDMCLEDVAAERIESARQGAALAFEELAILCGDDTERDLVG